MTMLGRGDLSPRRRHRHVGRWLSALVVLVVVLAGLSYVGYGHFHHSHRVIAIAPGRPCRTADTAAGPASAHAVRLTVRNATLRTGLAATVAHQLRGRGFHVTSVGNASRTSPGVATVSYPAGKRKEAQAVAAQIAGATMTMTSGGGVVLAVGHDYHALRSVTAAAAAERAETPTTTTACPSNPPSSSPSPTVTGTGS